MSSEGRGLPAIVEVRTPQRACQVLGIPNLPGTYLMSIGPDGRSVRLSAGPMELLSGRKKSDDGEDSTSLVAVNQHALIYLPRYNFQAKKYQFNIGVNPELLKFCQVSIPGLCAASELNDIFVVVSAFKALDITQFDWVFSLTAID